VKESFVNNSSLMLAQKKLIEKINRFQGQLVSGRRPENTASTFRFQEKIEDCNPLNWLHFQNNPVKIYWSDREQRIEFAGVGIADLITEKESYGYAPIFERIRNHLNPEFPEQRYIGGIRFNPRKEPDKIWESFGILRFILPQIEISQSNGESYLACNIKIDGIKTIEAKIDSLLKSLNKIVFGDPAIPEFETNLTSRMDLPNLSGWSDNILSVLNEFRGNEINKVVLARQSSLEFDKDIEATILMHLLKRETDRSFHFYFQPQYHTAFFGASPERLYKRVGDEIFTEAVAGTRSRGRHDKEDKELSNELLNSEKDVLEHELVCEHIRSALSGFCKAITEDDELTILKTSAVQHLYRRFSALLKNGTSDSQILLKLNPTPAVSGYPKQKATEVLEKFDKIDRGWYSGPIGWISAQAAEFAVAIRSGLTYKNELHLYSGAGIVPDSQPEAEWSEIEQKIGTFLDIVGKYD
jgi:menaquinone-specific isochorismate synthase